MMDEQEQGSWPMRKLKRAPPQKRKVSEPIT